MYEPKLRFTADDGSKFPDWEEKKLGEVATRVTRKNKDNITNIPLTISSVDGLIDQRDFFNKVVASKDMSGYYLLNNGEFAYNKSYSKGYDFGSIKRLDLYDCGALSTLYICFALDGKENSDFYQKYFDSLLWYSELQKICAEGARNHGLLNVPTNDFFQLKLCVPSSKDEQKKIADFLSIIDAVIEKQKETVEVWEERKKGVMQKLFSQDVRFKADDGSEFPDWKEKPFGEIVSEFKIKTKTEDEDVLLSCAIGGVFLNSELFGHQRGQSNIGYLKIQKGTLILSAQNLHLGNANVNMRFEHGIISPAYKTYNIVGCSIEYMSQWVKWDRTKQFFYNATTVGASECRRNVDWDMLYSQNFSVPCLDEQQKIADCLSSLDDVIEKQKATLAAWEEMKKGLLQQMFV